MFSSPAYPVLLAMGALLAVLQIVLSTDVSLYGVKVYPLTRGDDRDAVAAASRSSP